MIHEQACHPRSVDVDVACCQADRLAEFVDKCDDGVVTRRGFRQARDEVHRHHLEGVIGYLYWLQQSRRFHAVGLVLLARSACADVCFNVLLHARPVEVPLHQFERPLYPLVSRYWLVVGGV